LESVAEYRSTGIETRPKEMLLRKIALRAIEATSNIDNTAYNQQVRCPLYRRMSTAGIHCLGE
jgi:hypothetical protein